VSNVVLADSPAYHIETYLDDERASFEPIGRERRAAKQMRDLVRAVRNQNVRARQARNAAARSDD